MKWQWSITCALAYNSGPSCGKNTTLGLASSENQALFIGITPDPLSYIDFMSESDILMSSATTIALISCTRQCCRAVYDSNVLVFLLQLLLM
jgi:hypothetical protein